MSDKPLSPCNEPGCNVLTREGRCDEHKATGYDRQYEDTPERRADGAFYSSARWRKFRRMIATAQPMICEECKRRGRIAVGQELDHIVPRKVAPELTFDPDNVQWLCRAHHNEKRAKEAPRPGTPRRGHSPTGGVS